MFKRSSAKVFRIHLGHRQKAALLEICIPISIPPKARLIPVKEIQIGPRTKLDPSYAQADLNGLDLLIVEDSPDNQVLIQMMLNKTGCKVAIAQDGIEGVAAALSHNYDVVLMDIMMPNMDGHEAVRTLRARGYTKPIVALTAHAMKEERERAVQAGFSHFLTKPIDRKSLLQVLEQIHCPLSLRI